MVAIFLSEDDAIISENFIAIAGDNLPMYNINILIPYHQPPTGPELKIKINPEADINLNGF